MPSPMSLPEMMRLSYRIGFLAIEMQLIFAARLWGFTRKVQEEAQALAEPLPIAPLADAIAPPKPRRAAPPRRTAAPRAEALLN